MRDSQSPDSTSTILESKSVDKKHAQAQKSNREPLAQASTQSLDSSIDCHALKSARNDGKNLDSISIIIPCFNEKSTIANIVQVVQSVQIPYHKEIIIVDDCSTDGTREILAALESIDCHANAGAFARNDRNLAVSEKVDSSK